MQIGTPIESLAAALHAACLRDLPDIEYSDRDWPAYRAKINSMSKEERAKQYARERATGVAEGPSVQRLRRPTPADCSVVLFPQQWGSTALGYDGGVACQAISTASTIIVEYQVNGARAVYFGNTGKLAYLVPNGEGLDQQFRKAVARQKMPSVREAKSLGWTIEYAQPIGEA